MANPWAPEAWAEEQGSPEETHEFSSLKVTQIITCEWADRYALKTTIINANNGIGFIYPHATPTAFAKKVTIESIPAAVGLHADGFATYEKAQLTIEYESPTFASPEDILVDGIQVQVTEHMQATIEAVAVPIAGLEWVSDGKAISPAEAPVKQIFGAEYVQTHHNISEASIPAPYGTINTYLNDIMGNSNSDTLSTHLLNLTFGIETVIAKPPVITRSAGGIITIEYPFKIDASGVNKYWRPDVLQASGNGHGIFDVIRKTGTTKPYWSFPPVSFAAISA